MKLVTQLRLAAFAPLVWAAAMCCAGAAEVEASIGFSAPGVFGRVDIGRYPHPELINPAPVIAMRMHDSDRREALYLWVPPEHQAHWKEHCREYHACNQPVYFVHHDWYEKHVHGERRHEEVRGEVRGEERGREHERDERERGR